jgi:hypothetical protein
MDALLWIVGGAVMITMLRGIGLMTWLLLLFLFAGGCTTMSPEDRAYRDQQITEGYLACRQWYSLARGAARWVARQGTVDAGHAHRNQAARLSPVPEGTGV